MKTDFDTAIRVHASYMERVLQGIRDLEMEDGFTNDMSVNLDEVRAKWNLFRESWAGSRIGREQAEPATLGREG